MEKIYLLRRIRVWLGLFMAALVLSGVTAFPLRTELGFAVRVLQHDAIRPAADATGLLPWMERVDSAVTSTDASYPFLAYGTDWLAFAHLVIAIAFVGPFLDPVRNKWVITFGLIACAGVIPLAMIAGFVRGIPVGWRLIDCCFGVLGAIPLLICRRLIRIMEAEAREHIVA
jgi:hypothetical protein